MTRLLAALILTSLSSASATAQSGSVRSWSYVQLDNHKAKWGDWDAPDWLRYFGLDMGDVDGDGNLDVLSGRFIYHNPGGDMSGAWKRTTLPQNVDGILLLDVDGDPYADVIAQALPDLYWFEATDRDGTSWSGSKIGSVPATSHTNSQGFERGQLVAGGKEEFVIAGDGNIYCFEIPDNPTETDWKRTLVAANTSDEGIGLGDLDGDGDLDIAAGRRPGGGAEPLILVTYTNPGDCSGSWSAQEIGQSNHPIDRVEIADFNGDGRADVVISEERWPGLEPDGNLFWYEQPETGAWIRHRVVTQYSMNNLDVADVDGDGDIDLITSEHKGPRLELQLWVNDGAGQFTKHILDSGKENHLGAQLADLDGDGDLDIVGAGWDQYQFMHVWRNDRNDGRFAWKRLSTEGGELPMTNGSNQQTASLVVDVNNDGVNDIIITDRSIAPAVVGLIRVGTGWERHVIDSAQVLIEAGGAAYDIDGDGDTDIVFGGEARSNEIWWWENPYPDLVADRPWLRHTIKQSGGTKHHDQAFMDLDSDGKVELVFWNQGSRGLFYAEIPDNPRASKEWEIYTIYRYAADGEMEARSVYPDWRGTHEHEGLDAVDMNGDGVEDIVGGGRWFEYDGGRFVEHIIDAGYTFTRAAAGQLIEGGRPEVVLVVGDGVGPLVLYEWQAGYWKSTVLIDEVDNGHTLDVVDFDGDGHLDIFNAEMRFGEGNTDSEVRILLGDGEGHFRKHVVARGFGVHEGRLVDLDGDGDLDVLGKPYSWNAPLLNIWLQESSAGSRTSR
jgi:hypothetical protein